MLGPKLLWIATALALLGIAAGDAQAGPEEEAAELAKRGRLLFDNGDFAEALKRYRAAYALFPHPSYLINEGYAAEQLGECTLALDAYRRFMNAPEEADKPKQARAVEHAKEAIPRLEKECGKNAQVITTGAGNGGNNGSTNTSGNAGGTNGATAPGLTGGADVSKTSDPGSTGAGFRLATYIGGAVTIGLLGYYGYEAIRLGSGGHYSTRVIEANNATADPITGDDICSNAMLDQAGYEDVKSACDAGDAAVTRANITLGVAGVSVAATLVFAYFGFVHDFGPAAGSGSVALIPAGPGEVGMSAVLRF